MARPGVLHAVAASLHGRSGVLFTPYLPPQEKGMYHALNITPEQSMLWATKYLVHANAVARQVLTRQDGLACTPDGQLVALPLHTGQPALADWLHTQSGLFIPDVLHFSDAYVARRTQADRVYCIQCCPVDNTQLWSMQGQTVACVVL